MAQVLILFAHPALEKSRVQCRLARQAKAVPGVSFHDLYETYPDFDIDVRREQELLLRHDIIVWQHPLYWYSSPAILKQWQDLVLQHNWAYGTHGKKLAGKTVFNVLSCGGRREAYSREGRNRYTIPELLAPFEQTARLCHMNYWPPFVVFGTHRLSLAEMDRHALQYRHLLIALTSGTFDPALGTSASYLHELIPVPDLP